MSRTALACTTFAALCLLAAAAIITAGPLDPPAGPIAPTYKTLADVEPRIAINATNTPAVGGALYGITRPGSYYLTADTFIPEGYSFGIRVVTGDVTIDLNGFRLDGGARAIPGIRSNESRLVIRNGRINSCNAGGIDIVGDGCLVEDVWVEACIPAGISLGNRARVVRCSSDRNAGTGIIVGADSIVSDCLANANTMGITAGSGSTVEGCTANGNPNGGISVVGGVVRQCTASNNTVGAGIGTGADSIVSECVANSNGVGIASAQRTTVERCTVNGNSGFGIEVGQAGVVRECTVRNNAGTFGINAADDTLVESSNVVGSRGITAGSRARVVGCAVSGSPSIGITVFDNSVVERCSVVGSTFEGISGHDGVSVLECTVNDNGTRGIVVSNGCTIASCTTRSNRRDGIAVNFSCIVRDNNCNGDGADAGLHGAIHVIGESNRIEGNHITYADVAMYIQAGGNTVVRNSLRGNTATINAVGGNDLAPFVPASAAANPWSNILN